MDASFYSMKSMSKNSRWFTILYYTLQSSQYCNILTCRVKTGTTKRIITHGLIVIYNSILHLDWVKVTNTYSTFKSFRVFAYNVHAWLWLWYVNIVLLNGICHVCFLQYSTLLPFLFGYGYDEYHDLYSTICSCI